MDNIFEDKRSFAMNRLSLALKPRLEAPFGHIVFSLDFPSAPGSRPTLTVRVFPEAIYCFPGKTHRPADKPVRYDASVVEQCQTRVVSFISLGLGVGVRKTSSSGDQLQATYEVHPEGKGFPDFVGLLDPKDDKARRKLESHFYV
jgi:hypothetical protein